MAVDPGTRVAGPVFVIARSALGVSTSMSMSLLLFPFESATPMGGVTLTLFTSVPVAPDGTLAFTVNVSMPPGWTTTEALIVPMPEAGQLDCALATHVQVTPVSSGGKSSTTCAPLAGLGPALGTTMV